MGSRALAMPCMRLKYVNYHRVVTEIVASRLGHRPVGNATMAPDARRAGQMIRSGVVSTSQWPRRVRVTSVRAARVASVIA